MSAPLTLIDVMAVSPFLTFFLVIIVFALVQMTVVRFFRHLDIKAHGWPPAHCDADGDFRDEAES